MCAKKKPAMLEPDMQDAVIYTRYSSHNQRDCSIEQQVADCEIFARQNNLRVVKVYADRHLSGTTDNRPQFQQMLKDAAHGHWAYVICWKIDRFARNRYDSATYKSRLKKAGVRVLYAKESIPDGPEGILLESVLEGSAEYYSAALAQNIRRGMKYNAEQCKVNSGSIPFGYCKGPDGRFAIHEANAEVVREIFRKAAAGMPFVDIANDLNSRGLKTSRGGRWNKGSFRLLMNEAYIGVYHFSDTRIEGGMPALIDQGTFWAANERLKANSSVRGRHQDGGDYLLTGKLKCAHCGSYMIGFSGTGKSGELHYYYGCQKRRRERACKKANVPREWIERVVVKAALDYVLRPDVMEWIADAVMEYQEREAASAQLAALTAELEENQKATDNVMKAIEAGIITSTTKQRLLDLEAKAQDLKRAIELEKLSHVRLERDQVLFWLDRFRGGSLQSQEFRRKVIDAFVSVVYLSDDHLRIAFNYSGGSNAEADFDLVMDAEAAAGELSKKFAQGHVASTTQEKSEPLPIGKRFGFFRLLYFLPRHFHFQSQQRGFFIDAACISGQSAVCSDNAVAGNDDRDHIVSDSPAHSLRRHPGKAALCGKLPCQCTIGCGLAAGDAAQQRPHLLLKGRASGMERRGKVRLLPTEINIQPASGLGEHGGLLLLMHHIQGAGKVLLPLEPEAGQADVISGQQTGSGRRPCSSCPRPGLRRGRYRTA